MFAITVLKGSNSSNILVFVSIIKKEPEYHRSFVIHCYFIEVLLVFLQGVGKGCCSIIKIQFFF